MTAQRIIVILNPGSTSTKLGIADSTTLLMDLRIKHTNEELAPFKRVVEQEEYRYQLVKEFYMNHKPVGAELVAVVGRGGLLRPVSGGTYTINQRMLEDCRSCRYGEHVSNLGALIAFRLAQEYHVPGFIVDPPTVDELIDIARISGVPGIDRVSRFHALNIRSVAFSAAEQLGKPLDQCCFVVAHMGGGISVAALKHGKAIDVNNALLGDGPFTPERAGTLPCGGVVDLAFQPGATAAQLKELFSKRSGLTGYLGTNDLMVIEDRITNGDATAQLVFKAMAFTVAKEIGARAAVLGQKPDAIILTGGMARSDMLPPLIREQVEFIAPVMVFPGERELEALAAGAFRVLYGKETAKEY